MGPDAAAYRVELYPGYHADRSEPLPGALDWQFEEVPAFFEPFGWRIAHSEMEADDLLYTYAGSEDKAGGRTLILTGDRDLFQCASESVTVLWLRGGARGAEVIGPAEVERRYGIPPELVPDFIALRGDPSDGLPGAKGIGEKTAAELLRARLARVGAGERDPRAPGEPAPRAHRVPRGPARLQGDRDTAAGEDPSSARQADQLAGAPPRRHGSGE